jgi:hypothetical protein
LRTTRLGDGAGGGPGRAGFTLAVVAGVLSVAALAFAVGAGCGSSFVAGAEGGADTGAKDAGGQTVDARIDTGPPSWCATQKPKPAFCEDFDEYTSVSTFLDDWPISQQAGGVFTLDGKNALSPPNALEAAGDSGAQVIALRHIETLKARPSALVLSFDLRINSLGKISALSGVGLAAISFGGSVSDPSVALALGGGGTLAGVWTLAPGATPPDGGLPYGVQAASSSVTPPSLDTWGARYTMSVTFPKLGPPCFQILAGPSKLLDPCMPLPPAFSRPSAVSIALGDYASAFKVTGTVDVEYDNVTFSVE